MKITSKDVYQVVKSKYGYQYTVRHLGSEYSVGKLVPVKFVEVDGVMNAKCYEIVVSASSWEELLNKIK